MQVTVKTENDSLLQMFAVEPKRDCPHITEQFIAHTEETLQIQKQKIFELPCKECNDKTENWICLFCNEIHCSRYVNAHMVEHCTKENHIIALSLIDLSFWCYECNSYITNLELDKLRLKFSNLKFSSIDDVENLADQLSILNLGNKDKAPEIIQKIKEEDNKQKEEKQKVEVKIEQQDQQKDEVKIEQQNQQKEEVKAEQQDQQKEEVKVEQQDQLKKEIKLEQKQEKKEKFTYEKLIEGLKNKKFTKIAFLTGAGISVAAGIPDFRTPGTGLYSQLKKYDLDYPEAIFELTYFAKNPSPFYDVASEFLMMTAKPVNAHYFQVLLQQRNQLLLSLTQNIDGLELEAGLDQKNLIQAHGHLRTGHCIDCNKEIDISVLHQHIKEKKIMKCECGGLTKPDIVFFGEMLPANFFLGIKKIAKADLAFIIGTSLAVAPFNIYAEKYLANVPLVCIDKIKPHSLGNFKQNLFIKGDIEEQLQKIIEDCEFQQEFEKIKKQ